MSCLDVMYHQSYGAAHHYLPAASQAAAAAAYKAAYYHHQQQRKLSVYSKMQECVDQPQPHCPGGRQQQQQQQQHHQQRGGVQQQGLRRAPEPLGSQSGGGRAVAATSSVSKDSNHPAEAEYLSSRCVLFTYFQGDIGDVVDEHFSRALSQSSAFGGESKPFRAERQTHTSAATGLWKDGVSLSENHSGPLSSSVWNSAYQSQPQTSPPCMPSVSLSVHPDFSPSPVPFHPADGALWAGHALSPAGLPPPASLPDSWTYGLNPQSAGAYPHVHDAYPHTHPRAHVHARHAAHAMLHSYPAHGHALDPRFGPLLLPGVRSQQSHPAPSPGSHGSPHSEGIKTEMDPSSSPVGATSTAWPPVPLHGPLEVYDSTVDQEKAKATAWF